MRKRLGVASVAAAILAFVSTPSQAVMVAVPGAGAATADSLSQGSRELLQNVQFSIQIGGGKKRAVKNLRRQGYTEIQIVRSGLTKTIAEACLRGDRMRIVMNALGGIREAGKIGRCVAEERGPDLEKIRSQLRANGYRRIEFSGARRHDLIEVTACRKGREYRMDIRPKGRDGAAIRTGRRCGPSVDIAAIRAKLRDQGYDRIDFTSEQPPVLRAEACRKGRRISLRMNANGDIRQAARVGRCQRRRPELSIAQIEDGLTREGFDRIEFTDRRLPGYVAEACRRDTKLRLRINRFGEVRDQVRIGRCPVEMALPQIRQTLIDRGYNRVRFTDRKLPRYVAEACNRRDRKFEIRLNRYGQIRDERRIGRCAGPLSLDQIRQKLRDKRYNRIRFTDRKLPKYVAEACSLLDRKFEISMNRYGDIRDERRIGRCAPEQTLAQLTAGLRNAGHNRIRFTDKKLPGYVAEYCNNRNRRIEVKLNQYGEVRDERRVGRCSSEQSVANITKTLEDRGFDRVRFTDSRLPKYTAEGCDSRNRKFEFTLNRWGEVTKEVRAGSCRETMRPREIRTALEAKGYNRIEFTDRDLPGYVAEACQRRDKVRLQINRYGEIDRERNIGRCRREDVNDGMGDYRRALRRDGYDQINFTDKELPGIVAEACKNDRRYRIRLNRRARIRRETPVGRCIADDRRGDVTPRDLRKAMRARGFNRIKFTDRNLPTIVAEACRLGQQFELKFDERGRLTGRERIGRFSRRCSADRGEGLSVREVEDALETRRYYNISFTNRGPRRYVADACRNGNKFELIMNRYGGIRSRRRTGFCPRPGRSVAAAPIVRYSDDEIRGSGKISADTCQDYVEYLLYQDTVLFDVSSATITDDSRPLLDRLANVLNRCTGSSILVAGHTDSDGSASSNQRLSERRAEAVRDYLNDRGVRRRRLSAEGYGEERPTASNNTAANKALNRRIEFVMNWDAS